MFLANGFNDFVSKPIDLRQLDLVLNKWIRDQKSPEFLAEFEKRPIDIRTFHIAGLDIARGLVIAGDSEEVYRKMLTDFVAGSKPLSPDSLSGLAASAHILRSGLFDIGASELAKYAAKLERAAGASDLTYIESSIAEFNLSLAELTGAVQSALTMHIEPL
jgi:hypothetical protein